MSGFPAKLSTILCVGTAVLVLSGCLDTSSGGPADTDSGDSGQPDGGSMADVQLSRSDVQPLDRVAISGIDDETDISEWYVRYDVESGEIPGMTRDPDEPRVMPLIRLQDGVFTMAPLLDTEGASVSLRITDGTAESAPMNLSIGALPPPRENAMADLKQAMERNLKAATEELGKDYPETWEHWEDNMTQMPAWLFPMMRTWVSLQNWPDMSDNPDAEQLLARILAQKPLISQIQDQAAMMENGNTALSLAAEQTAIQNNTMSTTQASTSRAGARNGGSYYMTGIFPINNAEQLSEKLHEYDDLKGLQRDIETFDEVMGTYLSTVATVASLPAGPGGAALVSAGRAAAIEALSNVAGNVAGTAGVSLWFLPSTISYLETTLDPANGQIDAEDRRENQLKLTDARAFAESDTVDLGQQIMSQISDRLTSAAGSAAGGSVEVLLENDGIAKDLADYGASQATEEYLNGLNVNLTLKFVWPDIDMMMADPQRWLDHEATTFSGGGRTILKHDATKQYSYEFNLRTPDAFAWPSSLLRFETNRDEFPRTSVDSTLIDLEYIELDVDPAFVSIEPDRSQPVDFSITVENSILHNDDDPYIRQPLKVAPQIGSVEFQSMSPDGTLNYHYLPPEEDFPDDTVVRVSTLATSSKGIRGDENAPPRTGTFRVTTDTEPKAIDVVPTRLCLEEGESKTFEAMNTFTGQPIPDGEVTWTASGGDIDTSGRYTAPGGEGERTVTAATENEEGDTLTDTASVTTGDCTCQWEAEMSYPKFAEDSLAGKTASLALVFDGNTYTGLHMTMESPDGPNESVSPDEITTLLFRFEEPVSMDREGSWATPVRLSDGSDIVGTGSNTSWATNFLSGEPFGLTFVDAATESIIELPPLRLVIDSMAPIESDDLPDQSATMKGRIEGLVGYPSDLILEGTTIPAAGPAEYAQLDANFQGVFSFRPPTDNTINCQSIE